MYSSLEFDYLDVALPTAAILEVPNSRYLILIHTYLHVHPIGIPSILPLAFTWAKVQPNFRSNNETSSFLQYGALTALTVVSLTSSDLTGGPAIVGIQVLACLANKPDCVR